MTGSHANNYRLVFDIGTARITPFDIAKAPMIDFRQGRTVTRSYSAENLVAEIEIAPEVLIYYNSTDFFSKLLWIKIGRCNIKMKMLGQTSK